MYSSFASSGLISLAAISRSATTGFFIAVAIDQRLGAAGELAGAEGRDQNQIETVRHLVHAIFNGNARHTGESLGWGGRPGNL